MSKYISSNHIKSAEQKATGNQSLGVGLDHIYYSHHSSSEEQKIYQHLLELVQVESPDKMIDRCRTLFIEGRGYPEPEISSTIYKIIQSKPAAAEFVFFLNRCCHILINRWHMQPQSHYAIAELVNTLAIEPGEIRRSVWRYREAKQLRELMRQFVASEQYLILRRFIQVFEQDIADEHGSIKKPLISLIRRYPYLYEHCLMNEDSTYEQKETVRHFQEQVQRKFEIDLSQYVTYKVRRDRIAQKIPQSDIDQMIRPVNNPTLLSDQELDNTLKQFVGKVECGCSYKELAHNFTTYSSYATTFHEFKDNLYEYLTSSIDTQYGKRGFNQRLYRHLQNTMPQADFKQPNEFLIVRTCSQLFNLLVINSQTSPQHSTFLDLITNQGTLPTLGLLVKIVLICRKIKPYLEKKFAILFNHYESHTTDCVSWLVGTLEQLNIAMSINFGNIDVSFFK